MRSQDIGRPRECPSSVPSKSCDVGTESVAAIGLGFGVLVACSGVSVDMNRWAGFNLVQLGVQSHVLRRCNSL